MSSISATDSVAVARRVEATKVELLAQAMAKTLADVDVRRAMFEEIQNAGLGAESKLLPRDFFSDTSTSLVVAKVRQTGELDGIRLRELISSVRELEMYIPVREQRKTWNGTAPVLVAFQISKDAPIVAFDHDGRRLTLNESVAPSQVVLALVPRELRAAQAKHLETNKLSRLLACDDPEYPGSPGCIGGGGGGPAVDENGVPQSSPSGLYMTYSEIVDLKEPWIRGSPEITAYILGPNATDADTVRRNLSCSDEASVDLQRRFDQNSSTWGGAALLLDSSQVTAFHLDQNNRDFSVALYEDDDQGCVINDDGQRLIADVFLLTASLAYVGIRTNSTSAWGILTFSFLAVKEFFIISGGNDDYIGLAVGKSSVGYVNSQATHALVMAANPTTLNGGVKLVWHTKVP